MLNTLTVDELDEWRAFFCLEPWGYRVENHRMGVVTATLANFIGRLTGSDALKPSDIFPTITHSEPQAVSATAAASLGEMLKSLNGQ